MSKTKPAAVAPSPMKGPALRVARALSEAVEADGVPVVRRLYELYRGFSGQHFGGRLPECAILLSPPGSPRALGDHCAADEHGLRYRVRIAPSLARRGELVHVACSAAGDAEPGYKGHGPKFAERCNVIGAELGLPPVGVKGRDGLPNCAQWPTNVRPPGYYPPDAKRERKVKAAKDDAGGDAGEGESASSSGGAWLKLCGELLELLRADEVEAAIKVLEAATGEACGEGD